MIFLKVLGEK